MMLLVTAPIALLLPLVLILSLGKLPDVEK